MPELLLAPVIDLRPEEDPTTDWDRAAPIAPVRLSAVQLNVLCFVLDRQRTQKVTPTYREIAAQVGLRKDSSVGYQIRRLQRLGFLEKPPRCARAIRVRILPVAVP